MDAGGAYGAGKATGQFDPIAFVKRPQVILRAVSWLFAIIVFGCISSQGYRKDVCMYNNDPNACNFGTAIGVLAFLALIALLISDALFSNITSVQQRKYIVLGDMGFSGAWTFMWFVCFCYLADQWNKTDKAVVNPDGRSTSGVEAAIAFSFFSVASFGGLTYFAVMRYRQGVSEQFASGIDQEQQVGGATQPNPSPYSAYPAQGQMGAGEGTDPYQQAPFSQPPMDPKPAPPGDFQAPTY
ncbi:hypothetical protein CAPTEDRAFT_163343 [Capitella teleta]|uniref:Synaptogyrin n=1 Tax=Capitella teleta TaxID=283909 RepID=R7U0V5_CAPTE|nr:hypothetical protein CAPTEDRAFT_163343 [Capitella teleta]|eukprot:ELT99644.1 hypothetical protein CAPTEDRAFT_163343 [Capitella teleta]